MKLSQRTLGILKNFSSINNSLVVKAGNKLLTTKEGYAIIGSAEVDEDFPVDFAIYNLNRFLSSYANFDDPEIEFYEKHLIVKDNSGEMFFWYCDPEVVLTIPNEPKFPNTVVKFDLLEITFGKLMKFFSSLQLSPENGATIKISPDPKGGVLMTAMEKKNKKSNSYSMNVGGEGVTGKFKFFMKGDNLKIIPGNYAVELSDKRISKFVNKDQKLTYYVSMEPDSEYTE